VVVVTTGTVLLGEGVGVGVGVGAGMVTGVLTGADDLGVVAGDGPATAVFLVVVGTTLVVEGLECAVCAWEGEAPRRDEADPVFAPGDDVPNTGF
jgi:hypothetical protein